MTTVRGPHPMRPPCRAATVAIAVTLAAGLPGCADLGYYWQSTSGHFGLMHAARPVSAWLDDPATPDALRVRLRLAERIRRFASRELGLPDNRSYTAYADLHRSAALWNVVAAPPYSLQLRNWCFPVAGCVGYRGYYDEAAARAEAARLAQGGDEVVVYPVPAYSTLGWTEWLGGDPLLSTFIGYPEGELARIVFHELAHQVAYVPDDTRFNESFATAVERIGSRQWLAREADDRARADQAAFDARRRQFRALTADTRVALDRIYGSKQAAAQDWHAVDAMKSIAMSEFRDRYADLRAGWTSSRPNAQAGWDDWVRRANNAAFAAQAAYDDDVPAFEALHAHAGGDWPRFFADVRRLAALPTADRRAALDVFATSARPAAPNHGDTPGA